MGNGAKRLAGYAICAITIVGCSGDAASKAPDRNPPVITTDSGGYDSDHDQLVDLRLSWSDSAGVRPNTLSIYRLKADGSRSADLLPSWTVHRLDASGAHVEESIAGLLPAGQLTLEVSIEDANKNKSVHVVKLVLPAAVLHKTIASTRQWNGSDHGTTAVICDDRRLYVTVGDHLTIIDADSLRLLDEIRNPYAFEPMAGAVCVASPDLLYVADQAQRFDRKALRWLAPGNAFVASSIAASRRHKDVLFIGEDITGLIGVYDRAREQRSGQLPVPSAPDDAVFGLAVMRNDKKIYATKLADGGVLSIDRVRGVNKHIKLTGESWKYFGRSDHLVLSPDERFLYAAVMDGDIRGVAVIDTKSDSLLAIHPLGNALPQSLAVSPSGARLFVTTQDMIGPSDNFLLQAHNGAVLVRIPRPRSYAFRWDGGVTFHPNGKLIFVARDLHVDVYLNREDDHDQRKKNAVLISDGFPAPGLFRPAGYHASASTVLRHARSRRRNFGKRLGYRRKNNTDELLRHA